MNEDRFRHLVLQDENQANNEFFDKIIENLITDSI